MMSDRFSRKAFLASAAAAAAAISVEGPLHAALPQDRRTVAYDIRRDAATSHAAPATRTRSNGDESLYTDKRASFTKTLPHNDLGEVDAAVFAAFLEAIERGDSAGFESLPYDSQAEIKLDNPQAMYAFDFVGVDSHATYTEPAPSFGGGRTGVELAELFWHALTLDVPFGAFESDPVIGDAVADLNAFSTLLAPRVHGRVTRESLFRGSLPAALNGPLLSQFLLRDVPYGLATIVQRYRFPVPGQAFLTGYPSWLENQIGIKPREEMRMRSNARWMTTHRDLAEFVHHDFSFQSYLNAALIALRFGPEALSPTNPYRSSKREFGDITFGSKMILTMLAQASLLGQKAAYYHKWSIHRRARPEVVAARLDSQCSGRKDYGMSGDLLQSDAPARVRSRTGSMLLPQAYPEGAPTHPSYPSAHATTAGACATVLKAMFDEEFLIPDPVTANADGSALLPWTGSALTLGGEFEKLASNIAWGRHAGGVHFRADSVAGMLLGEAQGIAFLADYSRTFREQFDGFTLTTFRGNRLRIRDGNVISA